MNFTKLLLSLLLTTLTLSCSLKKNRKMVLNKQVFAELQKHSDKKIKHEVKGEFVLISYQNETEELNLKEEIHHISHEMGKCGGFTEETEQEILEFSKVLKEQNKINEEFLQRVTRSSSIEKKKEIENLVDGVLIENLEASISLLTSYNTRSSRAKKPNVPINDFAEHIETTLEGAQLEYELEQIEHSRTKQNSIKVTIKGSELPEEVVILGGHIDSTSSSFFSKVAPGADDNASGSAVVLEVLRSIAFSNLRPAKTLEFYWYAAEEQGLIGSKEIAESYKEAEVNVAAVMQLDMVLYPGNRDVIGLTEDFTNAEETAFMEELVTTYLELPVERYQCGYGCSDHASWFRSGFKTVYPFETTYGSHNKRIHTKKDIVDERSSFEHAARFVKLGVAFLLERSSYSVKP